jgi:hypothetical protein
VETVINVNVLNLFAVLGVMCFCTTFIQQSCQ